MSDAWAETTTAWTGTAAGADFYCYVETPAERAMRLSNAFADAQDRVWSGEDVAIPAALTTEVIDALAEYAHLLAFVDGITSGRRALSGGTTDDA